jgi:hypothetical protein
VAAQKAGLPQRAEAASSGGSRATRLILVAVAAVLLLLVGGAWAIWHFYLAPVATSVATVLLPPPPAPKPQPSRPEEPKASPAEIAYAAKLLAFLDACDATTRLLDESPKLDACRKQNEALNACYKAIETPPKGVRWAEDASTAAKELMQIPNALMTDLASLKDVFEAAGQSVNDNPGLHDAYSKASASMRQIAGVIRNQIPAACLPKSR